MMSRGRLLLTHLLQKLLLKFCGAILQLVKLSVTPVYQAVNMLREGLDVWVPCRVSVLLSFCQEEEC